MLWKEIAIAKSIQVKLTLTKDRGLPARYYQTHRHALAISTQHCHFLAVTIPAVSHGAKHETHLADVISILALIPDIQQLRVRKISCLD